MYSYGGPQWWDEEELSEWFSDLEGYLEMNDSDDVDDMSQWLSALNSEVFDE